MRQLRRYLAERRAGFRRVALEISFGEIDVFGVVPIERDRAIVRLRQSDALSLRMLATGLVVSSTTKKSAWRVVPLSSSA